MPKFLPKIIILAIVMLVLISSAFFLQIKSVEVSQNSSCVPQETLLSESNLAGKPLLLTSKDTIEKEIKNKYSCVDAVTVKKSLPSKLKLEVVVKKPVVKLEGTELFAMEDGMIVKTGVQENIPVLYVPQGVKVEENQKIEDKSTLFGLSLASKLSKSDFAATNIRIVDANTIAVYNQQQTVAIFSANKEADEQVDALQHVLARAKIDATKIERIDLRYNKPVIVNR